MNTTKKILITVASTMTLVLIMFSTVTATIAAAVTAQISHEDFEKCNRKAVATANEYFMSILCKQQIFW